MEKFRVKSLYFSGKRNKVHKSGEILTLDEIPGGEDNIESLIENGFLVSLGGSKSDDGDDLPEWMDTHATINSHANSFGFEFPEGVTRKDDKISALVAFLETSTKENTLIEGIRGMIDSEDYLSAKEAVDAALIDDIDNEELQSLVIEIEGLLLND
jgi:hypothetical protein